MPVKQSMRPKGKKSKSLRVVFNPTNAVLSEVVGSESKYQQRSGKYAHFCYEWDEMLIDENDPEFDVCNCGKPNPKT